MVGNHNAIAHPCDNKTPKELPLIPQTAEEYCFFLQGEVLALNVVVRALLESHPDKDRLQATIEKIQARAQDAMKQTPPQNVTLFRYEQFLEQLIEGIQP